MTLGKMRNLGVQNLVASCLNDAYQHVALIDVSSYPADTDVPWFRSSVVIGLTNKPEDDIRKTATTAVFSFRRKRCGDGASLMHGAAAAPTGGLAIVAPTHGTSDVAPRTADGNAMISACLNHDTGG
jgi:hypothetical protein